MGRGELYITLIALGVSVISASIMKIVDIIGESFGSPLIPLIKLCIVIIILIFGITLFLMGVKGYIKEHEVRTKLVKITLKHSYKFSFSHPAYLG